MLWFYIMGEVVGAVWLGGEMYIISKKMPKCILDWAGYVLATLLFLLGYVGVILHV